MKRKRHLKVKKSEAGLGLFTQAEIPRGDFIIHYTGEKIDQKEADQRGGRYLFTVKRNVILDGKNRKHLARYINHSCKPNCMIEVDVENETIDIYAKRKIAAGEELTYNYGKEYWEDFIGNKKCICRKCKNKKH